ncbi:protein NEOXANTHIN-DEFICIENT 1 isoform X1 [Arabidopsis lyrata subsp. lyrata]|uniref:protein NEOXANTHIN-DEFICIENT 1 isoform X1 n=1 Tax=Arabidopsis lyrata subsp. lyrata TaxID=81972 RepID=UPI000A29A6A3|nr:protein NEOXANTHIN-DEFICIENT 1 isoform X1 [Arabidopsis lyrata subsp. lyrata]|eukprot:XP_020867717.1 protein NEOXANTHIN-DEFICIENT 1 isoform X1 [Arabidopsis lyrata subsp. lyrata]
MFYHMWHRLHQSMDVEEKRVLSGYAKPPWIFKGSALYQIHLVKAATARAFIPKEFRLVEAFGYTLGGFFLASYDDSPAGVFDELVVIAGIVWNPPTSCAWAARVLVNSDEACHHGRKEVGLPSQVARFSKNITAVPKRKRDRAFGFLDTFGLGTTMSHPHDLMEVKVSEVDGADSEDICNIQIRSDETKVGNWMGPAIKMALPSFSGNTKYNSNLLKYSCHLHCRVRPVRPAVVSGALEDGTEIFSEQNPTSQESLENERRLCVAVMLSKPIIALQFKCLTMQVEAPVVKSKNIQLPSYKEEDDRPRTP